MRMLNKPSTAKCTLEHYRAFLLAEAQSAGCVRLSEVSGGEFAHDAVNRFLNREAYSGRDLFEEARPLIALECLTKPRKPLCRDGRFADGKTDSG
jgi:hypothetical protein